MSNSRRTFLQSTLVGGGLLLAKDALGEVCFSTPEQTTGPFIPDDFPFREANEGHPFIIANEFDADLTSVAGTNGAALGQTLYLNGQIVDENCRPVAHAKVYLWQADDHGHYNHSEDPNINTHATPDELLDPNFQYRGIVITDEQGRFRFKTIKPRFYPLDPGQPDFKRTAHLHIAVMKDGYRDLFTQTYFEGDALTDIEEIRRLNRIDILLGEWQNRRPTGRINPVFLPLIVNYDERAGYDAPAGDVRLSIVRD